MADAVEGDPRKDEQFLEELSNLMAHVELFTAKCADSHETGRSIVHNLDQRNSRQGIVFVDRMIGLLYMLRADLFMRNDVCNEQGRGGLSSAIKKLKESVAGGPTV